MFLKVATENGWSGWMLCAVHQDYKHFVKVPFVKLWVLYSKVVCRGTSAERLLVTTKTLDRQIKASGGVVTCHTRAAQYLQSYHAERNDPFTSAEEQRLTRYLERRFCLFEESAWAIISDNWPTHRRRLPGAER